MELHELITRYQLAFLSINRSVNSLLKQHVHDDITTDQFTFLQFVAQHEQVTATQIAQFFGIGKSAITAFVNRLVQKDLLQRRRSEKDRRIIYLSLTDKGKKVVMVTEQAIHRYLIDKLSHFNQTEIEKFLTSLEKLSLLMENDAQL